PHPHQADRLGVDDRPAGYADRPTSSGLTAPPSSLLTCRARSIRRAGRHPAEVLHEPRCTEPRPSGRLNPNDAAHPWYDPRSRPHRQLDAGPNLRGVRLLGTILSALAEAVGLGVVLPAS